MNTDYSININWSDEDGEFVATVPEFDGLIAFGETYEEALSEVKDALAGYIEEYKERNYPLPEPTKLLEYSGQFRLRIPKSLHKSLAFEAEREGVSLNNYVNYLLSERHIVSSLEEIIKPIHNTIYNVFTKEDGVTAEYGNPPKISYKLREISESVDEKIEKLNLG